MLIQNNCVRATINYPSAKWLTGLIIVISCCSFSYAQQVKYPSGVDEHKKKCKAIDTVTDPDQVEVITENENTLIKIAPASFINDNISKRGDGLALIFLPIDSTACNAPADVLFLSRDDLKSNIYSRSGDTMTFKSSAKPKKYQLYLVKNGYICQQVVQRKKDIFMPANISFDVKPFTQTEDTVAKVKERGLKTDITVYYKKKENKIDEDIVQRITSRLKDIDSISSLKINGYISVDNLLPRKQDLTENINAIAGEIAKEYTDLNVFINVEQNWQDFYNDVQLTRFSSLSNKSKFHIKTKLISGKNRKQLESILSRHRKIVLKINSRLDMSDWDERELLYHLKNAYRSNDLSLMLYIQDHMFDALENGRMPADLYKRSDLPLKYGLGPAFLNQVVYKFQQGIITDDEAIVKLRELRIYYPEFHLIDYNLLKFQLGIFKNEPASVSEQLILELLSKLEKSNEYRDEFLHGKVYYHMIKAQHASDVKNYDGINFHLDHMLKFYSPSSLSSADAVKMARFFIHFKKPLEAETILYQHYKNQKATEELLYEYLKLPFPVIGIHSPNELMDVIEKSYHLNKSRFCNEFAATENILDYQFYLQEQLGEYKCNNCKEILESQ